MQGFVDAFGVSFPVLLDPTGGVYQTYRPPQGACQSPFPLDLIIDAEGIIRYWKCEYDPVAMIAVIDDLLGGGVGVGDGGGAPAAGALSRPLLEPNWPNPFNPFTRIAYALPAAGRVEVSIHAAGGRLLRVLESGRRRAGRHVLLWDGRDQQGRGVASGVYLYRVTGPGGSATRKLTLVR